MSERLTRKSNHEKGGYVIGTYIYCANDLRIAVGIPNWMDRIKSCGNAVVPQQFYPIFKAIHDIEEGAPDGNDK